MDKGKEIQFNINCAINNLGYHSVSIENFKSNMPNNIEKLGLPLECIMLILIPYLQEYCKSKIKLYKGSEIDELELSAIQFKELLKQVGTLKENVEIDIQSLFFI